MSGEQISQKVVAPADGPAHGYFGTVQDDAPNEAYTVAGVTAQPQAEAEEQPKPAKAARSKAST